MSSSEIPFYRVLLSASGLSIAAQFVSLARQIALVSVFGFSRELDLFSTAYALLAITFFSFSAISESVFTALLTEFRIQQGIERYQRGAWRYVGTSFLVSALLLVAAAFLLPILTLPFLAGFDAAWREKFIGFLPYCSLWAFLMVPYSTLGVALKCGGKYTQYFFCELVVAIASTTFVYTYVETVVDLAIAFGASYLIGVFLLAIFVWRFFGFGWGGEFRWRDFSARAFRHFGAAQVGTLITVSDRYWQSHLSPGGIASLALVQQLTMNLASLLSFRDVYIVPLADPANRARKLERLLVGLFLIGVMASAFLVVYANEVCEVLFLYGKVSSSDVDSLAVLFRIGVVGCVFGLLATPVWKLLQIDAKYRVQTWVYLGTAASITVFGYFFIGIFSLGTPALACIGLFNALWACVVALCYAHGYGARLPLPDLLLTVKICVGAISASAASWLLCELIFGNVWLRLFAGAGFYVVALGVLLLTLKGALRKIVFGE